MRCREVEALISRTSDWAFTKLNLYLVVSWIIVIAGKYNISYLQPTRFRILRIGLGFRGVKALTVITLYIRSHYNTCTTRLIQYVQLEAKYNSNIPPQS
jgi:hypothetical protein